MSGQFGTTNLQKIAVDTASLLNAAFKGGISAVFGVLGALNDLRTVDFTAAGNEVKELGADDRAAVEASFKGALDLTDKKIQAKVEAGLSLVDDGFVLAAEGIELYKDAVVFEQKVKSILGV